MPRLTTCHWLSKGGKRAPRLPQSPPPSTSLNSKFQNTRAEEITVQKTFCQLDPNWGWDGGHIQRKTGGTQKRTWWTIKINNKKCTMWWTTKPHADIKSLLERLSKLVKVSKCMSKEILFIYSSANKQLFFWQSAVNHLLGLTSKKVLEGETNYHESHFQDLTSVSANSWGSYFGKKNVDTWD